MLAGTHYLNHIFAVMTKSQSTSYAFKTRPTVYMNLGHIFYIRTIRHLATLQPSVPAPSNRHLVEATQSKSSEGSSRHRMSFRFRSTDDSASLKHGNDTELQTLTFDHTHLTGSIDDERLTILADNLFLLFFSQPVTFGNTGRGK